MSTIFTFLGYIIGGILGGLAYSYGMFAITKKLFRNRTLSYAISGCTAFIIYVIMLIQHKEGVSIPVVIICMLLTIATTAALVIGERRALKSGRHSGNFEEDRGARLFKPKVKAAFKKFRYPFLKNKSIFTNISDEDLVDMTFDENDSIAENVAHAESARLTFYLLHGLFIFIWYLFVFGIWFYYFWIYCAYWAFAALFDTLKDLYTQEGSRFSFRNTVSEITHSEELQTGLDAIKRGTQSAASAIGNRVSSVIPNKDNAAEENHNISDFSSDMHNNTENDSSSVNSIRIMTDDEIIAGLTEEQKVAFAELTDDKKQMVLDMRRKQLAELASAQQPADNSISDIQSNTEPVYSQSVSKDNAHNGAPSQSYDTSYQHQNNTTPQYTNNYSTRNTSYSPPPVQPQSDFQQYSGQKNSNTVAILLAIIVILLLGIAIIGLLFLINGRKNESTIGSGVSSDVITEEVNEQKTTVVESEKAETMEIKAETTTKKSEETPSSNTKGTPIVASQSKVDIYSKYLDIANSMNLVPPSRGFLIDLNSDGINEMIVPDTYDMTYKLYYFDGSSVKSHSFGGFMAVGNFEMFSVDGDNGKKYIYFRDNYSYKSSQGYFSFDDMSEIDIFLNFTNAGSGTADWRISYNGSETYAEGTENVSQLYGETKQCYAIAPPINS